MTALEIRRGNPFSFSITLSSGWTGAMFTGGFKIVMREWRQKPSSAETDDSTAYAVWSVATGEISFVGAVGTVSIPSSITTTWAVGAYRLAAQGVVAGAIPAVHEMAPGTLSVLQDYARAP